MFFVFRGTKYDDIGPNHTKENKKAIKTTTKQPKTSTHCLWFLWTGQGTFWLLDFHRPNGAKKFRFGNFPYPLTCLEEVQKCTGQKCTKHQLVLLTILKVLGPKKANNSWNSSQIDHRVLLAHSWTYGTKIWRRQIMAKSAKSISSCFCFLAPPSGALVVSQFQDPVHPSIHPHIALVVLICFKLCLNAPDWIWQSVRGQ